MWRAASVVGAWTLASRVLGFARDVLIAAALGAGPAADAFFIALKLPNLFRRLFTEGAFAAGFVPPYAAALAHDPAAARRLAGELACLLAVSLGVLVLAAELFMPSLLRVITPGLPATQARFALAVTLTRISFPYLLLICLAALCAAMLNAAGRFAAAAAAPVLFNLILIGALFGLRRLVPGAAHALALGVLASGFAQLGLLGLRCRRLGLLPRLRWPRRGGAVGTVLRRMAPGLLGAGVGQLNIAVGIAIGSLLPQGTIAVLYYADRMNQLPLGLVGAALGTALLPALAADHARGAAEAAAARLSTAIGLALLLAIPAALALLLLARPIIQVLFGHGAFTAAAVAHSASALAIYALGLPFQVLARVLAPGLFAAGDTLWPLLAGAAAAAANLALGLLLIGPAGFLAPAIAASAAAALNAFTLLFLLRRRFLLRRDPALRRRLPRIACACAAMAVAVSLLAARLAWWFARPGERGWLALACVVAAGLVVYGGTAQMLGAADLRRLRDALRKPAGGAVPMPRPIDGDPT